jgi:hypothetical protein
VLNAVAVYARGARMPCLRIKKKIDKEIWVCKKRIEQLTFDKDGEYKPTLSKTDIKKSHLIRYILKKLPTHYKLLADRISEEQ